MPPGASPRRGAPTPARLRNHHVGARFQPAASQSIVWRPRLVVSRVRVPNPSGGARHRPPAWVPHEASRRCSPAPGRVGRRPALAGPRRYGTQRHARRRVFRPGVRLLQARGDSYSGGHHRAPGPSLRQDQPAGPVHRGRSVRHNRPEQRPARGPPAGPAPLGSRGPVPIPALAAPAHRGQEGPAPQSDGVRRGLPVPTRLGAPSGVAPTDSRLKFTPERPGLRAALLWAVENCGNDIADMSGRRFSRGFHNQCWLII